MKTKKASPWKSMQTGLVVLAALVVFAYGFEITKIDLEELRSEQRQTSLQRVTRALVRPDIIEFEQEEERANAPVYVPCPADGSVPDVPASESAGPYIVVSPSCAAP